jgi:hypothetical protein
VSRSDSTGCPGCCLRPTSRPSSPRRSGSTQSGVSAAQDTTALSPAGASPAKPNGIRGARGNDRPVLRQSARGCMVCGQLRRATASRGHESAQRIGLYDMLGNASKWVRDPTAVEKPLAGNASCVVRGGAHGCPMLMASEHRDGRKCYRTRRNRTSGFAARSTNFRDGVLREPRGPLIRPNLRAKVQGRTSTRNGITLARQGLPFVTVRSR